MIRVAFGSVPKDGGTFTFYRNMRPALLKHDIDMRCVALGKQQAELWEEAYVDEGCVLLAPHTRSLKKQAMTFEAWCRQESIDIVLGINSAAILSSLPHLPESIRCMSRCANSFDHGYRITMSGQDRLARIIAQTPRQFDDLTNHYNADPNLVHVIPNGIETDQLQAASRTREISDDAPLRIGFLGRLEDAQKGVFYMPPIISQLQSMQVDFTLKIAGKGKHEAQLRQQFTETCPRSSIHFLGALPPHAIPEFLGTTDVFLFPSNFEGCPNALLEAMIAGCVPVPWKLDGITDYIIDHNKTGYLAKKGDCASLADAIRGLADDRPLLRRMSHRASEVTIKQFGAARASSAYAKVFQEVMQMPLPVWHPTPWEAFRSDPNFRQSWKDWIPSKLKRAIKQILGAN